MGREVIRMVIEASECSEKYALTLIGMSELRKKFGENDSMIKGMDADIDATTVLTAIPTTQCIAQLTRFKQRPNKRIKKCTKNCLEV